MLRLKLLRLNAGESQWAIARMVGMSQGRYSMIERGLVSPTPKEREALGAALSASASSLLRPVVNTPPAKPTRAGCGTGREGDEARGPEL
jgi:transcriptional regulator with XRE-family HTH domain